MCFYHYALDWVELPLAYFVGGPYNGHSRRLAKTPEEYFPPSVDVPRPPGATYRRATPPQMIQMIDEIAIVYVYFDASVDVCPRSANRVGD